VPKTKKTATAKKTSKKVLPSAVELPKPTKKTLKEPETMEELLSQAASNMRGFKVGDPVEGILTEKTKKTLYLDIGGKTEGMVIDREMKAARDFIKGLEVGDKVRAIVTQPENDKGQTLLSLKHAASDSIWGEFDEKLKTGEVVTVRGKEVNRGGLIVDVRGLQGFIPSSCFGAVWANKINLLMGRDLQVKTIEVDREKNRLIFSEREVSEAGILKAQEEALKKVKIGEIFDGVVTGVMTFGLFVKIETKEKDVFLEGLVHISEISWEKVDEPGQFFKENDKVKVKVLAVDEKSGKLNLSIKQLMTDPWQTIEEKYKPETKVSGKVVKLAPFGAFVNLEPGIEGLIHISKIPVEQSLDIGDSVNCYVESVDREHRRMSLGLVITEKPVGYK